MCKYCINKSVKLIEIYQDTLSPDHSKWGKAKYPAGYCKFTPTCSEYTKLVIKKNGFFIGWIRGFWRVLRCNPFNKGGVDNP